MTVCPRSQKVCDERGSLEGRSCSVASDLLAKHPDTLIARKRGVVEAQEASRRAAAVLRRRLGRFRGLRRLVASRGTAAQSRHDGRSVDRLLVHSAPRGYDTITSGISLASRFAIMTERYKVRVTKDHFVFCSGHFISYEGDKCERLHGHNYRTAVEIEGVLDENQYVFDFIALKHRTKAITDELDHRMMLPTQQSVHHVVGESAQRPCPLPRS